MATSSTPRPQTVNAFLNTVLDYNKLVEAQGEFETIHVATDPNILEDCYDGHVATVIAYGDNAQREAVVTWVLAERDDPEAEVIRVTTRRELLALQKVRNKADRKNKRHIVIIDGPFGSHEDTAVSEMGEHLCYMENPRFHSIVLLPDLSDDDGRYTSVEYLYGADATFLYLAGTPTVRIVDDYYGEDNPEANTVIDALPEGWIVCHNTDIAIAVGPNPAGK